MLTLPIKKKWFDLIVSGEKKVEYRKRSWYYTRRLQNLLGNSGLELKIRLRNGYRSDSPSIIIVVGDIKIVPGCNIKGPEKSFVNQLCEYFSIQIQEVRKDNGE